MLNYKDFRCGNLVNFENRIFEIDTIAKELPTLNTTEFGIGVVSWNNLKAIELTEDWFDKFYGFENIGSESLSVSIELCGDLYLNFNYEYELWQVEISERYLSSLDIVRLNPIQYVHELQNLYHTHTKQ